MNPQVAAHIEAERRLRDQTATAIAQAWTQLPSYDDTDVPSFLARAIPVVLAAQRVSAALTNAFLGQRLGRQPLPLDLAQLVGAAVRNGAAPEDVYRRPFVTVWSSLQDGVDHADAVLAGLERATSTAMMDVQLTMRQTLVQVGELDERIVGYQRVPDGDACEFCQLVSGMRYLTSELMPIHNRCGCGVDVITSDQRDAFFGNRANDLDLAMPDGVGVAEHGELGPVLVNPEQHFTRL